MADPRIAQLQRAPLFAHRRLGPDDFFGEIALLDHGPRTATVVTDSPTICQVLGPRQFHSVLRQQADIATAVFAAVAGRLRATGGAPAD